MTERADLAIIGGGPGGYVAAIHAAQEGASVTLVEKDRPGGTCAVRGCIPTKALLEVAKTLEVLERAREMGVVVSGRELDLTRVRRYRDKVVRQLVGGVKTLLEKNGVTVLQGTGRLVGPHEVEVAGDGGTERIEARAVIVATGSVPARLPLGPAAERFWDSDDAVTLPEVPARLAVIGGGPVGVEFADIYRALGAEVTVIEMMPTLLPREDAEMGETLARSLKRRGIRILTGVRVREVEPDGDGFLLRFEGGAEPLAVDRVLVGVGRRPAVAGLGLETVGLEEGWIRVGEGQESAVPGLYAIGDVTGQSLLAHAASAQGLIAVDHFLGRRSGIDLSRVPSCTFTRPEVASVGLTEAAAREAGYEVRVGRFPFSANAKASAMGEREGLVKVVASAEYEQILGVHIIGPDASSLIHEAALALTLEATLDDVEATIHAHPTLAEAFAEACLDAKGRVLHLPPR